MIKIVPMFFYYCHLHKIIYTSCYWYLKHR